MSHMTSAGCVFVAIILLAIPAHAQSDQWPSQEILDHKLHDPCSGLGQYIFVGGTAGFNTLADSTYTKGLFRHGNVGLYQHAMAISAANKVAGVLPSIEKVFNGTGAGQAELGQVGWNYFTLPAAKYPGYYQAQYIQQGLHPTEANVNIPYEPVSAFADTAENELAWTKYVDAARSVGIQSVAPVYAPNTEMISGEANTTSILGEFSTSPVYALIRFEALYGKGLTLDSPPNFFLRGGSGPGYQKFVEEEIRWANANGIRTTMLVSPFYYSNPDTFLEDTKKFVKQLEADQALPSQWSVDDYQNTDPNANPYTDKNKGFYMGPDSLANSTTGVGIWLAKHAPVYVYVAPNVSAVCYPNEKTD